MTTRSLFLPTWLACTLAAVCLPACGGDDVDACASTPLALADSTRIVDLTAEQRNQLCDTTACSFGGYGAKLTCNSGQAVTLAGSRSSCLAGLPRNPPCDATLADLRRCMTALKASPCVATFLGSSECDAVTDFDCVTITPDARSNGLLQM